MQSIILKMTFPFFARFAQELLKFPIQTAHDSWQHPAKRTGKFTASKSPRAPKLMGKARPLPPLTASFVELDLGWKLFLISRMCVCAFVCHRVCVEHNVVCDSSFWGSKFFLTWKNELLKFSFPHPLH